MSDSWLPDLRLRRRCRGVVRGLALPPGGVDIHTVRERLEVRRGRRVDLTPVAGSRLTHGLWASTADVEYVQYERHTTRWHQDLIVCHEFAHMLLGHDADAALSPEDRALLVPDLPGVNVDFILRREVYDSRQEQEAEFLAALLMQHIDQTAALPNVAASGEVAAVARLMQSLGDLDGRR